MFQQHPCVSANISVHVNNLKNSLQFEFDCSIMAKYTKDESAFHYAQQCVAGSTKIW